MGLSDSFFQTIITLKRPLSPNNSHIKQFEYNNNAETLNKFK